MVEQAQDAVGVVVRVRDHVRRAEDHDRQQQQDEKSRPGDDPSRASHAYTPFLLVLRHHQLD